MESSTAIHNPKALSADDPIRVKKILFTERLVLRPLYQADAPALFEACTSDPQVTRYLTWAAHGNVSETVEYIRQCHESGGQSGFIWVAVSRASGKMVGVIECRIEADAAALGYLLGRGWWGQGYAKEAVGAVATWVETLPQIRVLWAYCDTENAASKALLRKLGFRFYCVMPEKIVCPALSDKEREAHCYTRNVHRLAMPEQPRQASA